MKKIIIFFLTTICLGVSFSLADCASCRQATLIAHPTRTTSQVDSQCTTDCISSQTTNCVQDDPNCIEDTPSSTPTTTDTLPATCDPVCVAPEACVCLSGSTDCTCIVSTSSTFPPADTTVNGITIGSRCLLNGQCKLNIYDTLGIKKSIRAGTGDATSVGLFVQDIVLSATMFIGTLVTVALVVSGLMYIFAGVAGKEPTKARDGMVNSLIGLLIVACSYFLIRLIQYIAKGF